MGQPYVGEIRIFAGSFAPVGWEFCNGRLVPISEADQLFALIGTTYGGDGQETFALPDLRGRVPIHFGTGAGLSARPLSEAGGTQEVTLTSVQTPTHTHPLLASNDPANSSDPGTRVPATPAAATPYYAGTPLVAFDSTVVIPVGGSQPHTNLQPYACVNYIISFFGIFPSPT
jgi:microcystin-dependent protein